MASPFLGHLDPANWSGDYNATRLIVERILADVHTATLVVVESVTNSGADAAVGYVDVKPLVQLVDADGKVSAHGTIHNVPYFRLQGGANAVILDPQVGDIGICLFAERDISSVKANKAQSAPGSARTFAYSDGLYIGGVLNGVPTQYVRFSTNGIELKSPTAIDLNAPDVKLEAQTVEINASSTATVTTPTFTINGETVLNGALSQGAGSAGGDATFGGSVTATGNVTGNGVSLDTHTHPDPQGGNTGAPN